MKGTVVARTRQNNRSNKRRSKTINISLDPIEWAAAKQLINDEASGVASIYFGRLIDQEMRAKIGRDWREQTSAESARPGGSSLS